MVSYRNQHYYQILKNEDLIEAWGEKTKKPFFELLDRALLMKTSKRLRFKKGYTSMKRK